MPLIDGVPDVSFGDYPEPVSTQWGGEAPHSDGAAISAGQQQQQQQAGSPSGWNNEFDKGWDARNKGKTLPRR